MNSHFVFGTAGHVDHGKTSFVRALTGIETDRLKDEKIRGITIENGYAHLDLPNGQTVGFIDVPGHEKFVKAMIAGAMGMDAIILVIAADEGIKPQTIEHFNIAKHLNLNRGFVLLTKCDLVDDQQLQRVTASVNTLIMDSPLEQFSIEHFSVYQPETHKNIIKRITEILLEPIENKSSSATRLFVDRKFTSKGFGTIITGTLIEGQIKKGDSLQVYPSEKKLRVKDVQVYGKSVEIAEFGQRTALNISLEYDEIHRGDLVTSITSYDPSYIIDVTFEVDDIESPVHHWQRLKLYHGTKEILCRLVTEKSEPLQPNHTYIVQLRLETPIYCKANDAIILRSYSPVTTLGGGKILTTHAKKRGKQLDLIESELLSFIRREPLVFQYSHNFAAKLSLSQEELQEQFCTLKDERELIQLNSNDWMTSNNWNEISQAIVFEIEKEFKQHPLSTGLLKETLRSKLSQHFSPYVFDKAVFSSILDRMIQSNEILEMNHRFTLKDTKIIYTKEQLQAIQAISDLMSAHSQKIVPIKDVFSLEFNKNLLKEILYHLINIQNLVKINDESIIRYELYLEYKNLLLDYLNKNGHITVSEYRDLLNISRKSTVMLLEHFDTIQLTLRDDNTRTLIKK